MAVRTRHHHILLLISQARGCIDILVNCRRKNSRPVSTKWTINTSKSILCKFSPWECCWIFPAFLKNEAEIKIFLWRIYIFLSVQNGFHCESALSCFSPHLLPPSGPGGVAAVRDVLASSAFASSSPVSLFRKLFNVILASSCLFFDLYNVCLVIPSFHSCSRLYLLPIHFKVFFWDLGTSPLTSSPLCWVLIQLPHVKLAWFLRHHY